MKYVLYNPLSGKGEAKKIVEVLFDGAELIDMTTVGDMKELCESLEGEDALIISGGDGTLNRFVNLVDVERIKAPIFLLPIGTGNDFASDIGADNTGEPIEITEYLRELPTVTVNGTEYKFINGVGYGIDGYCCEVGDKLKSEGKQPNYALIAISGLLFHYKPCSAIVTVDGVEHEYKKVWIAPTMNGRYYGGGMIPTPEQSRKDEEHKLSVMIFHDSSKIKTLAVFPSIFKGEHVKATKFVEILEGKEISVKFTDPKPLQIDGETILGVTEYAAHAYAPKMAMKM